MSYFVAEFDEDFEAHAAVRNALRPLGMRDYSFVGQVAYGPELNRLKDIERKYLALISKSVREVGCDTGEPPPGDLPHPHSPTHHHVLLPVCLDLKPDPHHPPLSAGTRDDPVCFDEDDEEAGQQTAPSPAGPTSAPTTPAPPSKMPPEWACIDVDVDSSDSDSDEQRETVSSSSRDVLCGMCASYLPRDSADLQNALLSHAAGHVSADHYGKRYRCKDCHFSSTDITSLLHHHKETRHKYIDVTRVSKDLEYLLECSRLFRKCFSNETTPMHFIETVERAKTRKREEKEEEKRERMEEKERKENEVEKETEVREKAQEENAKPVVRRDSLLSLPDPDALDVGEGSAERQPRLDLDSMMTETPLKRASPQKRPCVSSAEGSPQPQADAASAKTAQCQVCHVSVRVPTSESPDKSHEPFDHATTHLNVDKFGGRYNCAECAYAVNDMAAIEAHMATTKHQFIDRTKRTKDAEFIYKCAGLFSQCFPSLKTPKALIPILDTIPIRERNSASRTSSEDEGEEERSTSALSTRKRPGRKSGSNEPKKSRVDAAMAPAATTKCKFPSCGLDVSSSHDQVVNHVISHVDVISFSLRFVCKQCGLVVSDKAQHTAASGGHAEYGDRTKEDAVYAAEFVRLFFVAFPDLQTNLLQLNQPQAGGSGRSAEMACAMCGVSLDTTVTSWRTRAFNHSATHISPSLPPRYACDAPGCAHTTNSYPSITAHRRRYNSHPEFTDRAFSDPQVKRECERLFGACFAGVQMPVLRGSKRASLDPPTAHSPSSSTPAAPHTPSTAPATSIAASFSPLAAASVTVPATPPTSVASSEPVSRVMKPPLKLTIRRAPVASSRASVPADVPTSSKSSPSCT